jgi:hypothetical protein
VNLSSCWHIFKKPSCTRPQAFCCKLCHWINRGSTPRGHSAAGGQTGEWRPAPAMAKNKRKNNGNFDAILAGFAQQPSKKAPAYQARRPAPQPQSKSTSGAPRSENTVRRLFKNIPFPWPTKISAFMWSPGRRPQDAYDETVAETKPAPRVDPPQSETPRATRSTRPSPKRRKTRQSPRSLA